MEKRRVVITGMGMLTPLGKTIEENWQNVAGGKSGIGRITAFDSTEFRSQIAGEVKNFDPHKELKGILGIKEIRNADRIIQFGLYGARQALLDSGIVLENIDKSRIGITIGVGFIGIKTLEREIKKLMEKGPRHVSPFMIPAILSNLVSGQISISFGIKGFNFAVVSACASGSHAVGMGFQAIQRGEVDIMASGGVEAPISPIGVAGFANMKALSAMRNDEPQKASRPFDKSRDGFVIAEGAGVLILEELTQALKRGAKIYAEIVGFAQNSDAFDAVSPSIEGPRNCMISALREANIGFQEIDYINAHATSTPIGDENEAKAIKEVFKEAVLKILVGSTKSTTGHLLGAAGAVEAIFSVLAINHNLVPPNINLEEIDPVCGFLNVPVLAVQKEIKYALSNSFGFGGSNVCLIFKEFEKEGD